MNVSDFLNGIGKEKIASAIADAEKITGSELVVHINEKSDSYNETSWKSGASFMILYLLAAIFLHFFYYNYPVFDSMALIAGAGIAFPAGAAVAMISAPYRRALIGRGRMNYYTGLKAHEAFLHHEVFNTVKRSGILIYLSLFERSAVILGDTLINRRVRQEEWDQVISVITAGLKSGNKEEAIVKVIGMCGVLLRNAGIKKDDNDADELSNEVRTGGGL